MMVILNDGGKHQFLYYKNCNKKQARSFTKKINNWRKDMKKLAVSFLAILFVGLIISSCATAKPIPQQYPERWERITIGMSLEEFRQLWPEARSGGTDLQGNDVWYISSRKGFSGSHVEIEYFSFQENRLIRFTGSN